MKNNYSKWVTWGRNMLAATALAGSSLAGISQTTYTIGTGTSTSGTNPLNTCYNYNYSQQIYLAGDLAAQGMSAGYVSEIAFMYDGDGTTIANWNDNWVVFMANISQSQFVSNTDWVPLDSLTQVYSGGVNPVAGNWMTIALATPFYWDGTSNIVVAIDENQPGYSCTADWAYTSTANDQSIYYRSDATNPDPASPPTAYDRFAYYPNIQFFMPPLTLQGPSAIEISCNGDFASIPVMAFSGTAPYTIQWSTGQTTIGNVDTLFNAAAGSYSVTVTDNLGDADTLDITVTEPAAISVTSALVLDDVVCAGETGTAQVMATGGTAISGYSVDTNSALFNPDTTGTPVIVALGDDEVSSALPIGFDFEFFGDTVDEFYISSNGFISFEDFGPNSGGDFLPDASTPNNLIALNWEDLDPDGGNDGEINYYTIGTAPNRVLIVNFVDVPYWLGSVGDVTVQAKLFETTNCIEIHTVSVVSDGSQTQGIENQNGTEAFVYPGRNSQPWSAASSFIGFCPVDTSGLLYLWPDGSVASTNPNLNPGEHVVTVTDLNGCQATASVTVSDPVSALTLTPVVENVSCFGFNDASIDPGVSGGAGNAAGYYYQWSNGATSGTLSDLAPGTYGVVITDDAGCSITMESITISEPEMLQSTVVAVNNVVCEGDSTGSAKVLVTGGVAPYSYSWSPSGANAAEATGLTEGNYQVHMVDASGCNIYQSVVVIAQNEAPAVDLGEDVQHTDGTPVTLDAGNWQSYAWSNGATTQTIEVTASDFYTVTVTNAAGCEGTDEIYVDIWPLGIEDKASVGGLEIYPNPTTGKVTITLPEEIASGQLYVTDITGRQVLAQRLDANIGSIDLSGFAAGTYSIRLVGDKAVFQKKVVLK